MIGDFPIQFSIYTNCPLHHVFLAWEACDLENTDRRPQTSKTQTSKTQTSKTQTSKTETLKYWDAFSLTSLNMALNHDEQSNAGIKRQNLSVPLEYPRICKDQNTKHAKEISREWERGNVLVFSKEHLLHLPWKGVDIWPQQPPTRI